MHRLRAHHSGRRAWPWRHLHAGLQGPEVCARPTLSMLHCLRTLLLLLGRLGRLRGLPGMLLREVELRMLQTPRKMARPMWLRLLLVRVGHMPGGCRVDAGFRHGAWGLLDSVLPLHDLRCQAVLQGDILDAPNQEVIIVEGVLKLGTLQPGAAVLGLRRRWVGGCWRAVLQVDEALL